MGRKSDQDRLDQIRRFIQTNPNRKPGWIAKQLGLDNKTVQRALSQLERQGDMLSENQKGQVKWFGKRK